MTESRYIGAAIGYNGASEWIVTEPRKASGRAWRRRLTEGEIRRIHAEHIAGASLAELGRRVWRQVGYASPRAAATSIEYLFKSRGLSTRDHAEAVRLAGERRRPRSAPPTRLNGRMNPAYGRWHYKRACRLHGHKTPKRVAA